MGTTWVKEWSLLVVHKNITPLFKTLHDTHGMEFRSPSPWSVPCPLLQPRSYCSPSLTLGKNYYTCSSPGFCSTSHPQAFCSVLSVERRSPTHFPAPQRALAGPESFLPFNAELKLSFFSGSFLIIPGEWDLTSYAQCTLTVSSSLQSSAGLLGV